MNLPEFDFACWMQRQQRAIERALEAWVSADASAAQGHQAPAQLMAAMRYAVLDGGKRLRPLLVLAAAQAACSGVPGRAQAGEDVEERARRGAGRGGVDAQDLVARQIWQPESGVAGADEVSEAVLRAACAVELIHAYSLVHDDMPCMDNDVLRRGKPTVHVQFGQASALLAGDALQALAFELLTPPEQCMSARLQAELCRQLARAAGCSGMAGGQAIDLASVGHALTEAQLREMHQLKTGALLCASVTMGAACADPDAAALAALRDYGQAVGLAFQVVDDILDVTADSVTLGKTAGKDAEQAKPTYVSVLGLSAAGDLAQALLGQALDALDRSGLKETRALQALAKMVVLRGS